ncbi:MAG TPA: hypothetical protein PKE58_07455 [Acidobacteriota bacterium]|nr:hypothetical protein [Acidobacteriota bacterium]
MAAHPFDQDAVKTVDRILLSVMPDHSGGQQADAVRYFLQCLLEELCSVKKLRELLSLIYQQKSLALETKQVEISQKTSDVLIIECQFRLTFKKPNASTWTMS